jgi:ankyrin repeat domain-containing protein 50
MGRPNPHIEDYTVGWICALPIERAAAEQMLDEELKTYDIFTLGRIAGHNVAIASLPAGQIGLSSAATLASQMQSAFPFIRIGLMVGIGGGVPSDEADIRLGDVIISQPSGQHGGVVQYDLGKAESGGRRTRTGSLNTPPAVLLGALGMLRTHQYRGKTNPLRHLSALGDLADFASPEKTTDILFRADYDHSGGPTCDGCDKDYIVNRAPRSREGMIHYGTIASGNQVIKHGETRDKLSSELGGVLCFEMEAAGLMNSLPTLVIRGVCDYADSHKNESWQPYAAATAAACAKEILSVIPTSEISDIRIVDGTIKGLLGKLFKHA